MRVCGGAPRPRCRQSLPLIRLCALPPARQMRKSGMDVARVRCIFVTHMHGDHCFGTGGLLAAICEVRRASWCAQGRGCVATAAAAAAAPGAGGTGSRQQQVNASVSDGLAALPPHCTAPQARLGTPLQDEPVHVYGPPEMQQLVAFSVRWVG